MSGLAGDLDTAYQQAGQSPGEGLGNGRATVLRFAQEGAKVLAVDNNLASAQETVAMAQPSGECAAFAADVSPGLAAFMADAQVPWGVDAAGGVVSEPAWRSKPSWYLVATDDHMIPQTAQRSMAERSFSSMEVASSTVAARPRRCRRAALACQNTRYSTTAASARRSTGSAVGSAVSPTWSITGR